MSTNQPRAIPAVDTLLKDSSFENIVKLWGRGAVTEGIRQIQQQLREELIEIDIENSHEQYSKLVLHWLHQNRSSGYRGVFNLTGTLLHTNLGRAVIHPDIVERVKDVASTPATIEYNLLSGKRGDRETSIRERLRFLTDAEDASVVNNNAAAVMLMLHTLAKGRKVVVSRGELVEIGGSFRLPEIMEAAGCELFEVGTTNRTHLRDYEHALEQDTALILKVHPSNYRIEGFTQEVTTAQLAQLASQSGANLIVDVGSGALIDTSKYGIEAETTPAQALSEGADLVSFSGDKLLGGPQAGIIVGKQDLINQINANPMKRALRLYKVSLALLEETLKVYEDPDSVPRYIDAIRQLSTSQRTLKSRAIQVQTILSEKVPDGFTLRISDCDAEIGSGALPSAKVPSIALVITAQNQRELESFTEVLRSASKPVISRIYKRELHLDMHGAEPLEDLLKVLAELN